MLAFVSLETWIIIPLKVSWNMICLGIMQVVIRRK